MATKKKGSTDPRKQIEKEIKEAGVFVTVGKGGKSIKNSVRNTKKKKK